MSDLRVIGIDPGPTPGVVQLDIVGSTVVHVGALQCTADLLWDALGAINPRREAVVAIERFVTRARGRDTVDQQLTREQVATLQHLYPGALVRSAVQVKPWATDARLDAAGLLEATKAMRHARDAARHALFAAVHDGGIPDPLSKEWNR